MAFGWLQSANISSSIVTMHPSGASMLIMGEAVGGGAGVYGKSFPPAQFSMNLTLF